jgi:hypothetical protein
MKSLKITLMQNRLREAITPKWVPTETVLANAFIEEVQVEETSITVLDVYETYLNNLAPGERAVPLNDDFALYVELLG